MTDDLEILRELGRGWNPIQAEAIQSAPVRLVRATSASTGPGLIFFAHPVDATGAETEGGSGTLTSGSATVPVLNVGPGTVIAGDYLVARFVSHRWAAGRKATATGYYVTGCPCLVPGTIYMSVVHPEANFHMFHDATLVYGAVPSGLAPLGLGANAFLSTASFNDDFSADSFRYHIFCSSGFYCLTRVYEASIYGSPYLEATRYRWLSGLTGNTCVPFLLTNGKIFSGGDASTVITLSE